ncbi:beta-microseminoprotein-like [Paramormyrops kingsleyae]|uniref:beta-microseminoprotein-like n=1 Tax=Paramormyrops kingsleyae TaxID=1676925 RepID=UPI003B96E95E
MHSVPKPRPLLKKLVTLALLLCALLLHSEAACSVHPLKLSATHCQDFIDKTWHAVGSSWRNSECLDCTCSQCCHAYGTPVNLPEGCVKEFDKINCKYNVFKEDDPNQSCPYYGAVGK